MTKKLKIKNDINELQNVAEFIEILGEELSLDMALTINLNLVLEEIISNIILYGYEDKIDEDITIDFLKEENSISFTITDSGLEFDPTKKEDADVTLSAEEREIGGLGIYLVKQIMDDIVYQRKEKQNILTITKQI